MIFGAEDAALLAQGKDEKGKSAKIVSLFGVVQVRVVSLIIPYFRANCKPILTQMVIEFLSGFAYNRISYR